MAAATKSVDTNFLSLRTVYEKNVKNQNTSSTKVLVSDGLGGTFWAAPQALGALPTFNAFQTSAAKYIATETNRTLRLSVGDGFSMRESTLYGASLSYIDVSGSISINNSKLKITTTGFISASSDSNTNTILLSSSKPAPALSTGDLYFQQLKVISSVKAPLDTSQFGGNTLFSGDSYNFYTTFAAVSPLTLSSFTTSKEVFLSMYPYTAAGFLQLSTTVGSMYISSMSTISTLYITKPDFSTGMGSISTIEFLNHSTNVSTLVELSNYSQIRYLNAVGETLARAFVIQLTDQFGILNTGLSTISTAKTTKSLMYATNASLYSNARSKITSTISTFTDFNNGFIYDAVINSLYVFSTQLSTLSTSLGTNIKNMSNSLTAALTSYIVSTNSTFAQLGSIGYVSSATLLSTVATLPYISSILVQTIPYTTNSIFLGSLRSTVRSINDNAPYVSSLTLGSTLQSTVSGISFIFGNYIQTIQSTTQGIVDYGGYAGYVSSVSTLMPLDYISAASLFSTIDSVFSETPLISTQSYTSTLNGLGNLYTSSIVNKGFVGCFKSSIGYNGYTGINQNCYRKVNTIDNPFTYYSYNYDIYFSTAKLNLKSMSSYIVSTSRVQIDFNLSIYFPTTGPIYPPQYPTANRLVPISSFLLYNNNYVSYVDGTFTEYMDAYHTNTIGVPALCNFGKYEKRISFVLTGDDIQKTYSYDILLRHRVLFAEYLPNPNITLYLKSFPSHTNSIFVSIYN